MRPRLLRVGVPGDGADGGIEDVPVDAFDGVPQQAAEQGLRQLPVTELDRVVPDNRFDGFGGGNNGPEHVDGRRLRSLAHFLQGLGGLVAQPVVVVFQQVQHDRQRFRGA